MPASVQIEIGLRLNITGEADEHSNMDANDCGRIDVLVYHDGDC